MHCRGLSTAEPLSSNEITVRFEQVQPPSQNSKGHRDQACTSGSNTSTTRRTHLLVVAKLDVHICIRAELAPHGAIHLGEVSRPHHSHAHRRRHCWIAHGNTQQIDNRHGLSGCLAFCLLEERLGAATLESHSTYAKKTLSARRYRVLSVTSLLPPSPITSVMKCIG